MNHDAKLITESDTSPNPPPSPAKKTWHHGTLTYGVAGLCVLFFWLLWGDFAWSMKDRSVGPVVQLLLKKFGASDKVMGLLLMSLPAAIGLFLGPVISYNSDRHRGRWGRRIPFILITTPIAALAMVGLAFSGKIGDAIHARFFSPETTNIAATLLVFSFFWVIFDFATIAANAVFGGLINDVVPPQFLGRFFGMFRAISLIAGMIFNYSMIGWAEDHYEWLFIGIATLYGGGVTMMCLTVREGKYPPPPDVIPGHRHSFWEATKLYFEECFKNPYYLWLFMAMNLASLCFVPVNLYSVPFAQSLNMSMKEYGKYLVLTYSISLALAYFLGWLADKLHPLRLGMIAMGLYFLATLWGSFFSFNSSGFAIAFVLHGVLSGTYGTTTASLGQRLFPRSKFAQFASAAGIISSLTSILMPYLFGAFLDATDHHYRYTFVLSCIFSLIALMLMGVVYGYFVRLGGPSQYVAPEE